MRAARTTVGALMLGQIYAWGGSVVSHARLGNTVRFRLSDGSAEVEFLSAESFRLLRRWTEPTDVSAPRRPPVRFTVAQDASNVSLGTRELELEIDRASFRVRVLDSEKKVLLLDANPLKREAGSIVLERVIDPNERFFGLGPRSDAGLNARGTTITTRHALLISSLGYGVWHPGGRESEFDIGKARADRLTVRIREASEIEYFFYGGVTPKSVLEQHLLVEPQKFYVRQEDLTLDGVVMPHYASRLPVVPDGSWAALADATRRLIHASLSAFVIPALDLEAYRKARAPLMERAAQLAAISPIILNSGWASGTAAALLRKRLEPYLVTYFDEARTRGYPVIRPLPLQFSSDAEGARHGDQFLLGDEILVAPILDDTNRRSVYLPMGIWTDLRTNQTHRGRRVIEIEAPVEALPLFVRNGSLVPLQEHEGTLELHYFPRLGGEFFLYEPELSEISQFHASPAGDYLRLEIEAKVDRDYEWVIHNQEPAREVTAGELKYVEVKKAGEWRAGTWYYDREHRDLHVMVRAGAGQDVIVNVAF